MPARVADRQVHLRMCGNVLLHLANDPWRACLLQGARHPVLKLVHLKSIVTGCGALCQAENMELPVASPALVKLEDRDPFGRRDPLLDATPKLTIKKGRYCSRQKHLAASDPDLIWWHALLQCREWIFSNEA